jgi:hypothetical protein
MRYLRWLPLLLVLVVVWNMNLRPRVINLDEEQDIADPAVSLGTQDHSDAWGGLDRWAYPGLEYWRVLKRLEGAGFSCSVPQDPARGGQPQSGEHTVHCRQEKNWPLQRLQTLELRISYDLPGGGGRLLAAHAQSTVKPSVWREPLAERLRQLQLLEPATLAIRGLQAASTDALARIVADALLNNSWDALCTGNTRMSCNSMLAKRRQTGFPALPATAWPVGSLGELDLRLATIGFAGPARRADHESFMPVRVAAGHLWLDFERRDLAGYRETLAIALDPVGARPVRIRLQGRSGGREFTLAGKASHYNGEHQQWLFPLTAGAFARAEDEPDSRKALWLYPQDLDETGANLQRFAGNLAFVDVDFRPQLLLAYTDFMHHSVSSEAELKLQPPLQTADRMAAALQHSAVGSLLPATEAQALIAGQYPHADNTLIRAAWALYRCEYSPGLTDIDPGCWQRFSQSDPAASQLLQHDLQTQLQRYARLDPDHPVQQRLYRLATAYSRSTEP